MKKKIALQKEKEEQKKLKEKLKLNEKKKKERQKKYEKRQREKQKQRAKEIYGRIGLKDRDWSNRMIELFAPKPIRFVTNPMYKTANPVPIYELAKIKRIEKTKKFIEYVEKNKNRRAGAQKAVQVRIEKTMYDIKKTN